MISALVSAWLLLCLPLGLLVAGCIRTGPKPAEVLLCVRCGAGMEQVPGQALAWRCGRCGATSGATQ